VDGGRFRFSCSLAILLAFKIGPDLLKINNAISSREKDHVKSANKIGNEKMKRKTEKDCKSSNREHHGTNNTLRSGFCNLFRSH